MKTATVVTALPFIIVILIQTFGLIKWLREDYSTLPSYLIEKGEKNDSLRMLQEGQLIKEVSEEVVTLVKNVEIRSN